MHSYHVSSDSFLKFFIHQKSMLRILNRNFNTIKTPNTKAHIRTTTIKNKSLPFGGTGDASTIKPLKSIIVVSNDVFECRLVWARAKITPNNIQSILLFECHITTKMYRFFFFSYYLSPINHQLLTTHSSLIHTPREHSGLFINRFNSFFFFVERFLFFFFDSTTKC